ncbi:cell wall-binding repeat-containing protein [Bacillus salacetis]|uniref:cell wall-binding repeat-containing protein n=1 Tax=Bacillus salacetis TaxID=2315464 RepID=UPI003B9F577B
MKKKVLSLVTTASLVASSFAGVAAFNPEKADAALQETKKFKVSNHEEVVALAASKASTQELVIVGNGKVDVTSQLTKLGVKVKQNHKNYVYLADVPTRKIMDVVKLDAVRTVGKNAETTIDTVNDPELKVEGQNNVNESAVVTPEQHETHGATGVLDFHKKYNGSGVRIGIIDSGPDPGHESFTNKPANFDQTRKYGSSKIVAVRDYTQYGGTYPIEERYKQYIDPDLNPVNILAEGDVLFFTADAKPEGASVTVGGVTYNTAGIDASDDKLYVSKSHFQNKYQDLNGDGKYTLDKDKNKVYNDNFSVLLAGNKVYIDTDKDNDFTDETAYANGEAGTFDIDVKNGPVGANFRIADMDLDFLGAGAYKRVNLFTDFNGHGSHVSGIAAANGPLRANTFGAVAGEGVAPGAELVGMRVFKEEGGASTFSIQRAMVDAALPESKGGFDVDVANLSLGSSPDLNDGGGSYGELMSLLSEDTDIIFVTSAGNAGPGVDTVGSPGDVAPIISVGAQINAQMWAKEYNYFPYGVKEVKNGVKVPNEGNGLWYFSSVGPNEVGNQKPDIVGPGSAYAAHPVQAGPYVVMQGTSMSSPYVAGAVALLKSAALKDRIPFDYEIAREALIQTANHMDGYNRAQEGAGIIDVDAAYEYLREHFIKEIKEVDVTVYHGEKISAGPGLYVRNKDIPETVEVLVENNTDEAKNLNVSASHDWFTPSVSTIKLAAGESKYITVSYDKSKLQDGTNAGTLLFDDASTPYVEARSAQTIITGTDLNQGNHFRSRISDEVQSSKTKGYTFNVEPGMSEVRFSLNAISKDDEYQGRVRMIVFDPDGVEVNEFVGYAGYAGLGVEDFVAKSPKAGTWEVHVYGTAAPTEGKEVNKFQLEALAQGVVAEPGSINLGKVAPETKTTESVTFSNYLSNPRAVKVVTAGFSSSKPVSEKVTVATGQTFKKTIDIKNNVSLSVKTTNPTNSGDDIDLYLKDANGKVVAMDADADAKESFNVSKLPNGKYTIEVEGYSTVGPTTTVDLSVTNESVLDPGEAGLGKVEVTNAAKTLKVGESLTTNVEITTPEEQINALGAVYLLDANTNEVLSIAPIRVNGEIITEIAGENRIGTALAISQQFDSADTVLISTGYNFPDSLSAGPLASAYNAPILPVGKDGKLSAEVLKEIKRLGATNAYILGGESVVSPEVFTQLNSISINSAKVTRLSDDNKPNRYGTNLKVINELQAKLVAKGTMKSDGVFPNGVFVATGENFADALSAASVAGAKDMPIILTDGKSLSDEAKAILAKQKKVYLVGGTTVVSKEVESTVKTVANKAFSVKRLAGVNRYGTLQAILNELGSGTDTLFVASGKDFPDALSSTPLVNKEGGMLLLVDPNQLPREVDAFLTRFVYENKVTDVNVLGGQNAVSQSVRDALRTKVTK